MITIQLFPSTFLILFIFIFLVTIIIRTVRKNTNTKLFYIGIIELYVLLLFSITILPINIINPSLLEEKSRMIDYFQLIPFHTITQMLEYGDGFSIQIIGNIILLAPLPILFGFMIREKWCFKLFVRCALVSVGIEVIQVCIDFALQYPSRKFDIDDIILNTIGVLIGTMVYKVILNVGKCYNWIGENIVWEI